MIKLSVLYPALENDNFDMQYYCEKHIPMVKKLLGPGLKNVAVEQGLGGGVPGSPPTYAAMGHLYFDTLNDIQTYFAPHLQEISADIPNYTKAVPTVQVSEVKI